MTSHQSVTAAPTWKELRKQLAVAACGVVLAAAAISGISALSASGGKVDGGTHKSVATHAYRSADATAARLARYPTYYLVASQEQADRVESQMLSDPQVGSLSVAGGGHVVVIVSSPGDEARARLAVDDGQIAAMDGNRPGPKLVDLRP